MVRKVATAGVKRMSSMTIQPRNTIRGAEAAREVVLLGGEELEVGAMRGGGDVVGRVVEECKRVWWWWWWGCGTEHVRCLLCSGGGG